MKQFFILMIFSIGSQASDCEFFSKELFSGVYRVENYECSGDDSHGLDCYSQYDPYSKVFEVLVETVPTQIELALSVKLLEKMTASGRQKMVEEHFFSAYSIVGQPTLSCFDFQEDGKRILKMRRDLIMGDFKASTEIVKYGDYVEVKIQSTLNNIVSFRRLTLKE